MTLVTFVAQEGNDLLTEGNHPCFEATKYFCIDLPVFVNGDPVGTRMFTAFQILNRRFLFRTVST